MSGKPESRVLHARGRSGAARSQCDGANGNRREQSRMKLRFAMKTRALLTGIVALFLATGTATAEPPDLEGPVRHPHSYSRDEIGRCSLPHTPSDERLEEHEQCCKRWPNVPYCNGDWTRAMQTIRCNKLEHLANVRCAERLLERKKKNARSH